MLSDRQYAILQFIYQYMTDHGFVPSVREICRAVEISSTSVVNYNLERLAAQGYLLRTPGKARAFALTGLARELFEEHPETDARELREEIRLLKRENEQLRREYARIVQELKEPQDTAVSYPA